MKLKSSPYGLTRVMSILITKIIFNLSLITKDIMNVLDVLKSTSRIFFFKVVRTVLLSILIIFFPIVKSVTYPHTNCSFNHIYSVFVFTLFSLSFIVFVYVCLLDPDLLSLFDQNAILISGE